MAPEHSGMTIEIPSRRPGCARTLALLAVLAVAVLVAAAAAVEPAPKVTLLHPPHYWHL
jgi:hypothetical protein